MKIIGKAVVVFLIIVGLSSVSRSGELSELHRAQNNQSISALLKSDDQAKVDRMGIERTRCFGTCPAYTFIIKNDGTFAYNGEAYVKCVGKFTGQIPLAEFQRVAKLVVQSDFDKLDTTYQGLITDYPTVFTMISIGGQVKVILDYARSGPSSLSNIEAAIDDLLKKAIWDSPSPTLIRPTAVKRKSNPNRKSGYK